MNRLCLIEDDEIMGESLADRFLLDGYACDWHRTARDAKAAILTRDYFLVISDIRLPDMAGDELFATLQAEHIALPPFLFITGQGNIDSAVRLLKQGAQDYITKPFDLDALMDRIQNIAAPAEHDSVSALGSSPAMRHIVALLPRLAASNSTVLITGESGVGKERIARTIHQLGGDDRPFVGINCGALTETLLEAELFGYEKGAFTGAARERKGVFEQADGGTLFLDEIGEMPLPMQVRLLRAVQERTIVRVGGERTITVDIKLVCATNQDLRSMVEQGRFREDLYYRINVLHIPIPPLRERKEDILWLAALFLEEFARRDGGSSRQLDPAAQQALLAYPWPGNVRELRHCLERSTLLHGEQLLTASTLFPQSRLASEDADAAPETLADYLRTCERSYISNALDQNTGRIADTAAELGISRKNLWEKMKKLGLEASGAGQE